MFLIFSLSLKISNPFLINAKIHENQIIIYRIAFWNENIDHLNNYEENFITNVYLNNFIIYLEKCKISVTCIPHKFSKLNIFRPRKFYLYFNIYLHPIKGFWTAIFYTQKLNIENFNNIYFLIYEKSRNRF